MTLPVGNFSESGCRHDFVLLRDTSYAGTTERRVAQIVMELVHIGFKGTATRCTVCGEIRVAVHRPAARASP